MVVRISGSVNRLRPFLQRLLWLGGFALLVSLATGEVGVLAVSAADSAEAKVVIGGGVVEIQRAGAAAAEPQTARLRPWVARAAEAVVAFYGRLPVSRVRLVITRSDRGFSGTTRSDRGRASIRLRVPNDVSAAALADDWVLTHEMVHLALPDLEDRHSWLEEGVATYVEQIARARLGLVAQDKVWGDMLAGMPKGMPERGDEGLDRTPTWGRTYWGGAMFCLLADVAIRERTGNRRSLDDALRGILDAGGNITVHWDIARVLEVGDRATGVPVLRELYDRLGQKPEAPDLAALWKRLGVSRSGEGLHFDDAAPLAAIRRSMTSPRSAPTPQP
jgi:hypothetical protein